MHLPAPLAPAAVAATKRGPGATDDRRAPDGAELTAEELALIASCGERIRSEDWNEIRRAGLATRAKRPDDDRDSGRR